jgi:hypothetical protein
MAVQLVTAYSPISTLVTTCSLCSQVQWQPLRRTSPSSRQGRWGWEGWAPGPLHSRPPLQAWPVSCCCTTNCPCKHAWSTGHWLNSACGDWQRSGLQHLGIYTPRDLPPLVDQIGPSMLLYWGLRGVLLKSTGW